MTVVFSGDLTKGDMNTPDAEETLDTRLETDVDDYQRLTDSTGGLFIPSSKFEIDAITPILGDSVQSIDVSGTRYFVF